MFPILYLLVPSATAAEFCETSDPGSAAFIRNSYVELGLGNDGAFGEAGYPSSWHYRSNSGQFGFVANPQRNNWTSFYGDFFSPGSPLEAWGIEVGGVSHVNVNNGLMAIPGTLGDPACEVDICGNLGGAVDWSGQLGDLRVNTQYGVVNESLFIVMTVTLENVGDSTLSDVYWFRNVDPDNAVMTSGGYATTNTILEQPGELSEVASVRATGADGSDLYLMAADARARVTHGGFNNTDASDIWNGSVFASAVGAAATADAAISLAVRIGDMLPGQKETFRALYTLDETAIVEATDCASAPVDPDADGDGTPDASDLCPGDAENDADGDGVCGDTDLCPGFDDNLDADFDGIPDDCDSDADADGFAGEEDCDDLNSEINEPGSWYADLDADGYGDSEVSVSSCTAIPDYVVNSEDCDDGDPASYPGALETCYAEKDYNCDGSYGSVDEDGDRWYACEECDDSNPSIHPMAAEICDGRDNNCMDGMDEGCPIADTDLAIDTDPQVPDSDNADSSVEGTVDSDTGVDTPIADSDTGKDACPEEELAWSGGWSCGLQGDPVVFLCVALSSIFIRRKRQ